MTMTWEHLRLLCCARPEFACCPTGDKRRRRRPQPDRSSWFGLATSRQHACASSRLCPAPGSEAQRLLASTRFAMQMIEDFRNHINKSKTSIAA